MGSPNKAMFGCYKIYLTTSYQPILVVFGPLLFSHLLRSQIDHLFLPLSADRSGESSRNPPAGSRGKPPLQSSWHTRGEACCGFSPAWFFFGFLVGRSANDLISYLTFHQLGFSLGLLVTSSATNICFAKQKRRKHEMNEVTDASHHCGSQLGELCPSIPAAIEISLAQTIDHLVSTKNITQQ